MSSHEKKEESEMAPQNTLMTFRLHLQQLTEQLASNLSIQLQEPDRILTMLHPIPKEKATPGKRYPDTQD